MGFTLDEFRRVALALPGVEEGLYGGYPCFRVRKIFLARLRGEDQEDDILVLRLESLLEQQFLIANHPQAFFITDHYKAYPAVMVRMPLANLAEVAELFEDAWRIQAPRKLVSQLAVDRDEKADSSLRSE